MTRAAESTRRARTFVREQHACRGCPCATCVPAFRAYSLQPYPSSFIEVNEHEKKSWSRKRRRLDRVCDFFRAPPFAMQRSVI
eukprot:61269-Rhodomonas_salina.2